MQIEKARVLTADAIRVDLAACGFHSMMLMSHLLLGLDIVFANSFGSSNLITYNDFFLLREWKESEEG